MNKKLNRRIFYSNITHKCNNHCKYCFDSLTYNGSREEVTVKCITDSLIEHSIGEFDRFVVNGGEPTLHSKFYEIISCIGETGCELVLYSNGRQFSKKILPSLNVVNRITIPIHGSRTIHNSICQSDMAYDETVLGMHNLIKVWNGTLEVKIILNPDNVCEKTDFIAILRKNGFSKYNLGSIVITRAVECVISKQNNLCFDLMESDIFYEYFNNLLNKIMEFGVNTIKILDVPICRIDKTIEIKYIDKFSEFWVFDVMTNGRVIDYSKFYCLLHKKAVTCSLYPYCSSILKSYNVLTYDNVRKMWYWGLE